MEVINGTPALRLRFQTNEYSQQCRDDLCSSVKDEEENVKMSPVDVRGSLRQNDTDKGLHGGRTMNSLPAGGDRPPN